MKLINIITACTLTFFISIIMFAQEPDPNSFFPHSVGNIWEYDTPIGISRIEIIGDSVGNDGHIYLFYDSTFFPYYSIDTAASTVYYLPNSLNWLYYKLNADPGDNWVVQRYDTLSSAALLAVVTNVYADFVFGKVRTIKEIFYGDSPDTIYNPGTFWPYFTELLVSGIGKIKYWDEEPPGEYYQILKGCVIDGDTLGIITDVEEGVKTPNEFYLSQNYPNPFNPYTSIQYSIGSRQNVSLVVYDVLGNKVEVLVNEEMSAGEYEIKFNAGSLASGIYVYQLKTNRKIISKKMILLK